MSLAVYALTCGHLTGDFSRLMEGGEGRIRLPIPAYLIEHPKGIALFDTGMHPDCQHDPASRVGSRVAGLFEFDYHPGEDIAARLVALGRDIIHTVTNPLSRLTGAIHVYGGDFFAVSRSEWDPENLLERRYDAERAMRLFAEANAG